MVVDSSQLSGFNSLSDYDKGWVIGIIDGEGSPTVCNKIPRLACAMNDEDTIHRLNSLIPVKRIYHYSKKNPKHKDTYWWICYGKPALLLMMDLFPYLSERRQQQIQRIMLDYGK